MFLKMGFSNDMSILHHLKLHFFSNFVRFALLTHTTWFTPQWETEDVFPEVMRCEGLHKWKYDVVDTGEKQQKDPHQFLVFYQLLVSQNNRLKDAKKQHLHQPGCEMSRRCYDIPPPFLSHNCGLVREAQWDVPFVMLVHLQKEHHKAYELNQIKDYAGREGCPGEY